MFAKSFSKSKMVLLHRADCLTLDFARIYVVKWSLVIERKFSFFFIFFLVIYELFPSLNCCFLSLLLVFLQLFCFGVFCQFFTMSFSDLSKLGLLYFFLITQRYEKVLFFFLGIRFFCIQLTSLIRQKLVRRSFRFLRNIRNDRSGPIPKQHILRHFATITINQSNRPSSHAIFFDGRRVALYIQSFKSAVLLSKTLIDEWLNCMRVLLAGTFRCHFSNLFIFDGFGQTVKKSIDGPVDHSSHNPWLHLHHNNNYIDRIMIMEWMTITEF